MGKMTDRMLGCLRRLAAADYVSFTGHAASAAHKLKAAGLASYIGPDRWTGSIYQITPAGRSALEEHNGK